MIRFGLRRLRRDERGVTITEFAVVCPVMLILMMGLGELAYQGYVQSILTGALQKAGRDSTIEGNAGATASTSIDQQVEGMVKRVAANAQFQVTRKSYAQLGYIGPEVFTDTDHDGLCDHGEGFTDVNGNGIWDADPGVAGQGGADDAVVYKMTVSYPRLFPVAGLIGFSRTATLSATTILKNQPYASQKVSTVTQGVCP